MKQIYKLLILIFLLFSVSWISFAAYNAANDRDWDLIEDNLDKCPNTPKNAIVDQNWDAAWCSHEQKIIDTNSNWIPDYNDSDIDWDWIINTSETNWYTWTFWADSIYEKSIHITTNPYKKDTDSDSLNDWTEKTIWTDPTNPDTDWDWIDDWIDEEKLTNQDNIQFVNWSWSCDSSCTNQLGDRDVDSVADSLEKIWCLNTKGWIWVFTQLWDSFIWCSSEQKKDKLNFDVLIDWLTTQLEKTQIAIASWSWKNEEIGKFTNLYDDYNLFISDLKISNPKWYNEIVSDTTSIINPTSLKNFVNTNNILSDEINTNLDIKTDPKKWSNRWSYLDTYKQDDHFSWDYTWEKWISKFIFNLARDMKNLFIAIAIVYLLILTFRLFFWWWGDDDLKKWRQWILWTSIWIMLMQVSYVAIVSMYDKSIWEATAASFSNTVIWPLIHLLELFASFVFISMAIFAFYRMITWWWNEEWYKKWIQTITAAIIWFLLIKISTKLVFSIYWKVDCEQDWSWTLCNWDELWNPNLSETVEIARTIIKFATWFIGILVIILIIYAGFLILTSSWNEDRMKKAKWIFKYIIIWIFMIVMSVILFEFMGGKDISWIIWNFK
ncbi:MAG: hypothetical protein ACD_49C00068G0002 [uncultured bacterium (gcode 4)]|uniref:Uncharacterized protein n=1 Tax=uncultured bacterium (gcode 4) TaxID=1234023 RepID=K2AVX7_9BACT|nr:MAG: hypothetical protein ACD_49C00068G0002 [uncultured bacterium (gcode 4)]